MSAIVRVMVYDAANVKAIVHDRLGNHDDRLFREWMGKTAFWAFRTGHAMCCFPCDLYGRPAAKGEEVHA